LIGLARPLRNELKSPICCTLQGEDLFLEGLIEPYRQRAVDLIRRQVSDVDQFVPVSDYYVPVMSRLLQIPVDRMTVVPLGINLAGYERRRPGDKDGNDDNDHNDDDVFRVGYFARMAPEKGFHVLADAYAEFRRRTAGARVRLEAAGYLSRAHEPYLLDVRRRLERAGLTGEFTYRGAVDRKGKLAFLRSLDVLSVPATYDEPKGVFLLEAMASGVPVIQPRRGAFTEIVEKTGGGLLVPPDDVTALADGLHTLWQDRARAAALGEQGFVGVRQHYSIARSADRILEAYHLANSRRSSVAQPLRAAR
jgi:glycosyltransferase involved in cell wall biosynthesis